MLTAALAVVMGCTASPDPAPTNADTPSPPEATAANPTSPEDLVADVISVDVSGSAGAYDFAVKVESPDRSCAQYADWWEVISEKGELLYRRVMLHDHANEQPFTRSGGPVEIDAGTVVIVRAHMHPTGYGGQVMRGSVEEGFVEEAGNAEFANGLEDVDPLPIGCAF